MSAEQIYLFCRTWATWAKLTWATSWAKRIKEIFWLIGESTNRWFGDLVIWWFGEAVIFFDESTNRWIEASRDARLVRPWCKLRAEAMRSLSLSNLCARRAQSQTCLNYAEPQPKIWKCPALIMPSRKRNIKGPVLAMPNRCSKKNQRKPRRG